MDGRGAFKSKMWYFKRLHYGKIKSSIRFTIVTMAILLYVWYN